MVKCFHAVVRVYALHAASVDLHVGIDGMRGNATIMRLGIS